MLSRSMESNHMKGEDILKLKSFTLINFRGYCDATINFENFTTFVGVNDVGKSTIFEALDIFFGNSKMSNDDRNINCEGANVELIGRFDDLPDHIKLENVETSFSDEYLLNKDNDLEIRQVFTGASMKLSEYIVAQFPKDSSVANIHTMKISDLKKNFVELINNIDKRVSSEIRKAALKNAISRGASLETTSIPMNVTGVMKDISKIIHSQLPLYQLFKSDRSNTDSDTEIQDPIKAIVKSTIASNEDIQEKLQAVSDNVENAVTRTTNETLAMLKEMNPDLAKELHAEFLSPNWSSLFKFSLETDSNIPLNKRGSGVRRLILLNFFRSEAKRRINESNENNSNKTNVIYAFEEPETAQHPSFQQILINSFKTMVESPNVQVMITTHSPAIAKIVPSKGLRLIKKNTKTGAYTTSGIDALNEVVVELGLITDVKLYPDQIKKIVIVEGPDDVMFFQHIYSDFSKVSDDSTIFIAGGGTTVVDTLNQKFISQLDVSKRLIIVDGDKAGEKDQQRIKRNNPNVQIIQLNKSTIEFYLPYEEVYTCLLKSGQVSSLSQESWDSQIKLEKGQKRYLKKQKLYQNFDTSKLDLESQKELKGIIAQIDN